MSDNNGSGNQNTNNAYSQEYVSSLREEAASWRVKFKETNTKLESLQKEIESTKTQSNLQ